MENNWCHSPYQPSSSAEKAKKVWWVFWITVVVMVLEIVAGTWYGSMALLADGWHMGTHAAAFSITLFTFYYAKKHANNHQFSFGTGKVNYLGGFASAIALGIVAILMVIESIERLVSPITIQFNEAIIVAVIGLLVNVISVFILHDHDHDHDHDHHHEHGHDHNMRAAYFHVLADTLTSLTAIVALLAGKYFGLIWMDAVMGIVGAVVILRWAYRLMVDSSEVLLDKSVPTELLSAVNERLQQHQAQVRDLHVWQISQSDYAAVLSVSTPSPKSIVFYQSILKEELPQLTHVSIELVEQSS
ncbi:CDF family Co(II)/Ni(II) efflux transporter DmeF [Thalassotalea ganghwensis]